MTENQNLTTPTDNSMALISGETVASEISRKGPLVSAVITTYNRPTDLERAIESVRKQTYEPIELIIVDDHSNTPATRVLEDTSADGLSDVICVRHDENRGANAARNTGIRKSSGKYIAFLDDDDIWKPHKIDRQVAAFEQQDDIGVVYTGLITQNGKESAVHLQPEIDGNITKALLCRNVVGTLSTVMVRAEIAKAVPFDEDFPTWADLEWYINLSTTSRFHRIAEPLAVYEYDSTNRLSEDFDKKQIAYRRFLNQFDTLAGQFGRIYRRKMRAWAAFRLGTAAIKANRYAKSRQLLRTAIIRYPFEPKFVKYYLASVGGRYTHHLAREGKRVVDKVNTTLQLS